MGDTDMETQKEVEKHLTFFAFSKVVPPTSLLLEMTWGLLLFQDKISFVAQTYPKLMIFLPQLPED